MNRLSVIVRALGTAALLVFSVAVAFRRETWGTIHYALWTAGGAAALLQAESLLRRLRGRREAQPDTARDAAAPEAPSLRFVLAGAAAVAATAFWATAFSLAPAYSRWALRGELLPNVLAFFAAATLLRPRRARAAALGALFAAGVAAAALGIGGRFGLFEEYFYGPGVRGGRALGALISYSRSAMFFLLWTPLALAAAFAAGRRRPWPAGALGAGAVLAWAFVLLTLTRGALAVLALGALGTAAWRSRRAALVLAVCATAGLLATPGVRDRLVETGRHARSLDWDALLSERPALWRQGLLVVAERPWTGAGYGADIFEEPPTRAVYPLANYRRQPDVRQFYLQVACEGGLPHLAAYLFFYGAFLHLAARTIRRARRNAGTTRSLDEAIVLGAAVAVAGLLLYGVVGQFQERHVGMLAWYVAGLGCAAAPGAAEGGRRA